MGKVSKTRTKRHAQGRQDRAHRTRASLVATAMRVFNEVGYWGTDSNALARAAGYSPGTFYRHFADKRAIFLAAYEAWARLEHTALLARIEAARTRRADVAGAFVDFIVEHHGRWRTFRASLGALAANDPELQKAIRAQRRRHLDVLSTMVGRRDRARNLVVLYTLEGLSDALADGEPRRFGVSAKAATNRVRATLGSR